MISITTDGATQQWMFSGYEGTPTTLLLGDLQKFTNDVIGKISSNTIVPEKLTKKELTNRALDELNRIAKLP